MTSRKLRLLASASAASIAMIAAAPARADDTAKQWSAWAETEFVYAKGDPAGGIRGFMPVFQNDNRLVFIDGFVGASDSTNIYGSFGFGIRQIVNDRFILGTSAFVNLAESDTKEKYRSLTIGAEALTENFDFRVNYHHGMTDDQLLYSTANTSGSTGELSFEGNRLVENIGGLDIYERSYSGVEGEVGAKLPFSLPGGAEMRVFAGGYRYTNPYGPTIEGPRGRAELRIADFGGDKGFLRGARLTLGGEVSYDDVRGTVGRGELRMRIPFGPRADDAKRKPLSALEQRMTERVERREPILRYEDAVDTRASRYAVNPETEEEYGLFVFSDGENVVDEGTEENPTTFEDAVTKAGAGGVVVVKGDEGNVTTGGATLMDGQTVVGGGATFPVLLQSGEVVVYTLNGMNGVLEGTGSGPVVTLGDNNRLYDFTITGGSVGVYGDGVENFLLDNVTINSTAGVALTGVTGEGIIMNSMISTTGGVGLFIDNTGLLASDFLLSISGLSIDAMGGEAIDIDPLTIDAVFGAISSDGGYQGIAFDEISGSAVFAGAVDISNTVDDGIDIGDGDVDVTFMGPVTIANAGDDAIDIENHAGDITFGGAVTIDTPYDDGIEAEGFSGTFTASSTFSVNDAYIGLNLFDSDGSFVFADVVDIADSAYEGVSLEELTGSVTFSDAVTITDSGEDAIDIDESENATFLFGGAVTIDGAGDDGIEINGSSSGTPTGSIAFMGPVDIDNVDYGVYLTYTLGATSFNSLDIANAATVGVLVEEAAVGGGGVNFGSLSIDGVPESIVLYEVFSLNGAGISFGTTNISDTIVGVYADVIDAPIEFTGLTTISNPGYAGLEIYGVSGGLTFADVDITGLDTGSAGVKLNSASGPISFATLDIAGVSTTGTVGIDLSNAANAFNTITVDSGTITGVGVGVDLTNANNTGIFQYGDGSNTDADGAASTIDAVTPIVFSGVNPSNGVYNFRDVNLVGDLSAFGAVTTFWVLEGATGAGTREDPGSLADAELSGADTIILLNDPNSGNDTLDAAGTNADDTFTLANDQRLISFEYQDVFADVSTAPVNILTHNVGGDIVNVYTGSGAPTLTTTGGGADIVTLADRNELDGLVLMGGDSAVYGAGIDGFRFENSLISGTSGEAIDFDVSTGAQVFASLGISNPTANVDAISLANTSGALLMTDVAISSTGMAWDDGVRIENVAIAADETLDAMLTNVDVSSFDSRGIIFSLGQNDGGSISVDQSEIEGASAEFATRLFLNADWTGTLSSVSYTNNTLTGSFGDAIEVFTGSGASGSITSAAFDNNIMTAPTIGGAGLLLDFASDTSSAFNVGSLSISGNMIGSSGNYVGGDGVYLAMQTGSSATQSVTIDGNAFFANESGVQTDISGGVYEFAITDNIFVTDLASIFFDADDNMSAVTITDFSGNMLDSGALGGFEFYGAVDGGGNALLVFDADTGTAGYQTVDAGSLTIGTTSARVTGWGFFLSSVAGALSFDDLDIANDGLTGLAVANYSLSVKDFTLNVDSGNAYNATVDTINAEAIFLDPLTVNMNFSSVRAEGGAWGLLFDDVAGSFTVNGSTVVIGTSGYGVSLLSGNTGTFTFGDLAVVNDQFGNGGGVRLDTGTLNVLGLVEIDTTDGVGIDMNGGVLDIDGDVSLNSGNGFALDVTAGVLTIDRSQSVNITSTSRAINIQNTEIGADGVGFDTVSSTDGVYGMLLENLTGSGEIIFDGTFQSTFNADSGYGMLITGPSMTAVTFNDTVTVTQNADNRAGIGIDAGDITFNGAVNIATRSGAGIDIDGGDVYFTNGFGIETTSGDAFSMTGGGELEIGGSPTIMTESGKAINVDTVTIGDAGVYFDNVSVTDATASGDAIALNAIGGAGDVTLEFIDINGADGNGVDLTGSSYTGDFFLNGGTIDNVNLGAGECCAIALENLNVDIDGVTIGGAGSVSSVGVSIFATGGAYSVDLTNLNITSNSSSVYMAAAGTGSFDISLNNIITNSGGALSILASGADASATIRQLGNLSIGADGVDNGGLYIAGDVDASGNATVTFDADPDTVGYQAVTMDSQEFGSVGNRIIGDAISLTNVQGILSFDDLDIANDGGYGIYVNNSAVTAGKDFTLNVDAGDAYSATVDTINGTAIFLDPLAVNAIFDTVVSDSGAGIVLDGLSGSFATGSTTVTNGTGVGVQVSNAGENFSADFGNTSISSAHGVSLFSNDSTVMTSFDTLAITATNGVGLYGSSGGTININATDTSIDATGGAAVEINSTRGQTNGSSGFTFDTLTSTDSVYVGAQFQDISDDVTVGGALTVTGSTSRGLGVLGANSGAINFNGDVFIDNDAGAQDGGGVFINVSAATVNFNAALNVFTSDEDAFYASGGTIDLADSGDTSSLSSEGNEALYLSSVTLGANGFNLNSITSLDSNARGVYLNAVTQSGSNGINVSGLTQIQRSQSEGFRAQAFNADITLGSIDLDDTGSTGFYLFSVSSGRTFTINGGSINSNNVGYGLLASGFSGDLVLNDVEITDSANIGFYWLNSTGSNTMTGGAITGSNNYGFYSQNFGEHEFSGVTFNNNANAGIFSYAPDSLTLTNVTSSNNTGDGLYVYALTSMTLDIIGGAYSDNSDDGIDIEGTGSVMSTANISNVTANGNDGYGVEAGGAWDMSIDNMSVDGARSAINYTDIGIYVSLSNAAGIVNPRLSVTNSTVTNITGLYGVYASLNGGTDPILEVADNAVTGGTSYSVVAQIYNTTGAGDVDITGNVGNGRFLPYFAASSGTMDILIDDNHFGTSLAPVTQLEALRAGFYGGAAYDVTISNNTVYSNQNQIARIESGSSASVDILVTGNTFDTSYNTPDVFGLLMLSYSSSSMTSTITNNAIGTSDQSLQFEAYNTSTQCAASVSGNTFPRAGGNAILYYEIAGASLSFAQSSAALSSANNSASILSVLNTDTVDFGVGTCP